MTRSLAYNIYGSIERTKSSTATKVRTDCRYACKGRREEGGGGGGSRLTGVREVRAELPEGDLHGWRLGVPNRAIEVEQDRDVLVCGRFLHFVVFFVFCFVYMHERSKQNNTGERPRIVISCMQHASEVWM